MSYNKHCYLEVYLCLFGITEVCEPLNFGSYFKKEICLTVNRNARVLKFNQIFFALNTPVLLSYLTFQNLVFQNKPGAYLQKLSLLKMCCINIHLTCYYSIDFSQFSLFPSVFFLIISVFLSKIRLCIYTYIVPIDPKFNK